MNKHLYRIIFNRTLNLWQVVTEIARRSGRSGGSGNGRTDSANTMVATLKPMNFMMGVILGSISVLSVNQAMAQVIAHPNAPGNQRPTIINAPNGTPLVNIQTPSKGGVSRNTYQQFDVNSKGTILNNSRTQAQSQLGGWVQGNPWLAGGTAKVILNEVKSNNPSQLRGYVEVAGDRAQIIIANPAGIDCDGCGFINAHRTTLTTGTPLFNGGVLEGYQVEGGSIRVSGSGLDASRVNYTDLIARSVQINAGLWAQQLQITTGANTVSADHGQVTKQTAGGTAPQFALDVAHLGGMYAQKIFLLGTENGVGVRNAATIGAQAGELVVTVDGRLENIGSMQAQTNTNITARGGVTNTGLVSAGRELSISTPQDVDNSGGTLNALRLEMEAQRLLNRAGVIEQTGVQALALQAGSLSNREGGRIGIPDISAPSGGGTGGNSGSSGGSNGTGGGNDTGGNTGTVQPPAAPLADGVLRIAGILNNDAGTILAGGGIDLTSNQGLDNEGGHLGLRQLSLTGGDLNNRSGELNISQDARIQAGMVNNDAGQWSVAGIWTVEAQQFSNRGGEIRNSGTGVAELQVAGILDNTEGLLASNASQLRMNTGVMVNEDGQLLHAGKDVLQLQTATLQGRGGEIASAGRFDLTAGAVDHRNADLTAAQVNVVAESFDNQGSQILATGEAASTLSIQTVLNNNNAIIASNGNLQLSAATFNNVEGKVHHAGDGDLTIAANILEGSRGTLASNGALHLSGNSTNLRDGITSAQRIEINTGTLVTAGGSLSASGSDILDLHVRGMLDNTAGNISSNGALLMDAQSLNNQGGTILAAGTATSQVRVADHLDNSAAGTIAVGGSGRIEAGTLDNRTGTVNIGADLDMIVAQALDNSRGTVATTGNLGITAGTLSNRDEGVLASIEGDVTLAVQGQIDNTDGAIQAAQGVYLESIGLGNGGGSIIGTDIRIDTTQQALNNTTGVIAATSGSLTINSGALNNTSGVVQAARAATVNASSLDNRGGLVTAGNDLNISTGTIDNRDTRSADPAVMMGLQGGKVVLAANHIDNSNGFVAADHQIDITGNGAPNSLINANGFVSSAGGITITTNSLENAGGTLLSGEDQSIVANRLSGDGRILSQGDLALTLQQDWDHGGEVTANGLAQVSTAGTLTNRGTLQAGDLDLRAANLDNTASGEISGGRTHVTATNTLTNRGLIDGAQTRIDATLVDNVGTGRIYGDHLSIQAGTVLNREENVNGQTKAGTIAGRERLDIGAGTLINQEQALIFSGGSGEGALNIGGALDANGQAIGRAGLVHNASATIESLGDLVINTTRLLNSNEHFATTVVQVGGPTQHFEIQPQGNQNKYDISSFVWSGWSRAGLYRWKDDPPPNNSGVLGQSPVPRVGEQDCSGPEDNETCTRLPGADYLPDNPAWAYFGVSAPDPEPAKPQEADYADLPTYEAALLEWQTAHEAWAAETDNRYIALDNRIEAYNDTFLGWEIKAWTQFIYTSTEYETQVTSSAPGKILAGGNMTLTGDELVNDKSQIIAGGALIGDLGNLVNIDAFGEHRIHEEGTSQYTYSKWRGGLKRYHERKWDGMIAYTPADQVTTINLDVTKTQGNASASGSGYQMNGRDTGSVGSQAQGSGGGRQVQEVEATVSGPGTANSNQVAGAGGRSPTVIRSAGVNTDIPDSSLFKMGPGAGQYLIETDPRFANYRNWLSSDYLLRQMGFDPATVHKRLGDGFYEQKLVREQIAQLTGRRFLDGYASDEEQYQALLESGATYAEAWGLRPGIALSAEQMAQLTSDIVWLVEQTVTLPDGSITTALVPQVYVRVKPGDLDGRGTLIAANAVDVALKGDLVNSGTIAGRTAVQLTGENLHNLQGRITGDTVALTARTDLNNIGGTIDAGSALAAIAGRDINILTTTQSDAKTAGLSNFSRTNIDRVAGLYVTNPGGTLVAAAGRDANLAGAQVVNMGEGGKTLIAAGGDVNLGTVEISKQENNVRNADNYLRQGYTREIGTTISAKGDILLQAEGDINARAAFVSSEQGMLAAAAQGDVNITSGQASANLSEGHKHTHGGALNRTTKTTRDSIEETWSQGSTFSGNTVAIQANNIQVTGSNVISDAGTALVAREQITIAAAENTRTENHFSKTTRSGVFSGGEVGFTVGKQEMTNDANIREVTHTGSMIGSTDGRVDIYAGGHYQQTASDVIGNAGVSISGKTVTIEHAENTLDVHETQTAKSSGLHISVKGGAASAVASVYSSLKRADEVSDDRLKALYAVQAGQALYGGGSNPLGNIGGQVDNAKDVVNGGQQANNGGMSLRVGIGASSSKAESESHQSMAHGSTVYSGNGNVSVVAREGDLTIVGSQIEGIDTTVAATGNLILLSAKEANELKEKSSAKSGEIGITIGSEAGIGVYVSASMAKGKGQGTGTTHAETIIGGNRGTTTFISGGDTIGQGAQIIGDTVIGRVGGDFRLSSEQDTNDYQRKDMSVGIDVAVGTGGGSVSGYYNASKVNSTYTSVKEQTGVQAGNGGFDIQVDGHTQLDGAAIASTATPDKNYFSTGSLGWSDMKNKAEYSANSISVSGSAGSGGGSFSPSITPPQHEKSDSTTKAGIADGTLVVRDGSGAYIARSVTELQQDGLKEIFDAQKVAENMELGKVAGQVVTTAIDDIYNAKLAKKQEEIDKVLAKADEASANGDTQLASQLYEQVNMLRTERDEGNGMAISKTIASLGVSVLTGNTSLGSVLTYVGTTGGIAYWDQEADQAMRAHNETSAMKVICTKTAQECADLYRNMPDSGNGATPEDRLEYLRENGMTIEFINQIPEGATNITVNGIINDEARAGHVQVGHVSRENGKQTGVTYYVQYNASKGALSDLLQSGYDKFISPINGDYSLTTLALTDAVLRQGDNPTNLYAHSWGSIVTRNVLNLVADTGYKNTALTVAVFGPAVRPEALVDPMVTIVGQKNVFPNDPYTHGNLTYLSSPKDFVSTFVGGTLFGSKYFDNNSDLYIPGSARGEFWGAVMGIKPVFDSPVNPHSCYGLNCVGTKYNWTEQKAAEYKKKP